LLLLCLWQGIFIVAWVLICDRIKARRRGIRCLEIRRFGSVRGRQDFIIFTTTLPETTIIIERQNIMGFLARWLFSLLPEELPESCLMMIQRCIILQFLIIVFPLEIASKHARTASPGDDATPPRPLPARADIADICQIRALHRTTQSLRLAAYLSLESASQEQLPAQTSVGTRQKDQEACFTSRRVNLFLDITAFPFVFSPRLFCPRSTGTVSRSSPLGLPSRSTHGPIPWRDSVWQLVGAPSAIRASPLGWAFEPVKPNIL
jgi:hypothetical protein